MWITLVFAIISSLCPKVGAEGLAERYLFKGGQVWAVQAGEQTLLTKDVDLPNKVTVRTNGTFQVGTYAPRPFAEGQMLGTDGMLTSPNGQIGPVIDHVAMDAGKTVSAVDGGRTAVNQDIVLGTDTRLTPDRVLVGGERGWMRVIDGLLFTPEGGTIPTSDTISLQNGKVVVQKEGTVIPIEPGRSMMMNEGTKVFGDGRVVSKDGQATELAEGQIITIEGVVKLR